LLLLLFLLELLFQLLLKLDNRCSLLQHDTLQHYNQSDAAFLYPFNLDILTLIIQRTCHLIPILLQISF
jgi:hypothetical protein